MSSENSAENNQLNSVRTQGIDDASSDEELAQLTLNNRAEESAVVGVGAGGGAVASNYVKTFAYFCFAYCLFWNGFSFRLATSWLVYGNNN